MKISIASGKGGTGKTTIACSLASLLENCIYVDCDVEEPNGHIFFNPKNLKTKVVNKKIPVVNYEKCNLCSKCIELCEYNALVKLKDIILLFNELCHSCGVCQYFCPQEAITEEPSRIGLVRRAQMTKMEFIDGVLDIGMVSAAPLIKAVKKNIPDNRIAIIDCPPGTSCSMVEAVRDTDFCILVTESTPFGFQDLKLAVEVLEKINIPFGIVINKYDPKYQTDENHYNVMNYPILAKIPVDSELAINYSAGKLPVESPHYKNIFDLLLKEIKTRAEYYGK